VPTLASYPVNLRLRHPGLWLVVVIGNRGLFASINATMTGIIHLS
jgi:hypothetical protein